MFNESRGIDYQSLDGFSWYFGYFFVFEKERQTQWKIVEDVFLYVTKQKKVFFRGFWKVETVKGREKFMK